MAAAAEVEPEKASSEEPGLSPLFVTNLLAILAVGVSFCAWILHYTEWFPAIGGILALGGVLSWLAFVSRILPDHPMKASKPDDAAKARARATSESATPQQQETLKTLDDAIARARRGGER
jgi:hypothetical protein